MAGVKISALPGVPSAQLTDIFPVVQNNITSQESVQQLLAVIESNITGFVPISGGTMTGPLILSGDPTLPLGAATKEYVDTVASGFTVILACAAATTANLTATYANGAAGVGATLTNAGAMAAFAVDGYSASAGDRILVKDQTAPEENGVYSVTTVGSGAVNWVLTRTTDYDQAPAEIHPGTLVAVNNGTVNATTSWLETATVTTIGTDPILFSQFTFAPGAFLQKANNLSDVNNVATSRTNLGLGTAATKAASDNGQPSVSSVVGGTSINNIAVFADVNGSVKDGGPTSQFLLAANNLSDLTDVATARTNLGISNTVIQRVSTQVGSVATGVTTVPQDDTVPQQSEGNQFMTLTITPTSATSTLVIEAQLFLSAQTAVNANIIASLFQDATANALKTGIFFYTVSTAPGMIRLVHIMTAGSTLATTFKARAGSTAAGTTTFNGQAGARLFGGVADSYMQITEYAT